MPRFTDLRVWQLAHTLTIDIYKLSASFPQDERFGLTSQLRRAAVSISTNIAEGSKRRSRPDYARFLNLAEGSLAEVESLLLLARDLGFTKDALEGLFTVINQLAGMLTTLRRRVEDGEPGEAATQRDVPRHPQP